MAAILKIKKLLYLQNCLSDFDEILHDDTYSTLCLKKTAPLRQVGINSSKCLPIMIFHTRHHHSVADRLSSKSLVWVEYQLQGFHGNQAPNNCMLFITERNRRRRRLIYCL